MSQVAVDIRLIQWIESVLCVDSAPSRETVEALHERVEACWDAGLDPDDDLLLCEDTWKALDGGWLRLYEIRPIQQLRGWHRTRYGNVTVPRHRLEEVARVLDGLTLALGSECDETLREYDADQVGPPPRHPCPDNYWPGYVRERAGVLRSMAETGYCGECTWCQVVRLRDQCWASLGVEDDGDLLVPKAVRARETVAVAGGVL
jgi:hypothetical protein